MPENIYNIPSLDTSKTTNDNNTAADKGSSFDAALNLYSNAPTNKPRILPLGQQIPDMQYQKSFDNIAPNTLLTPQNIPLRLEYAAQNQSLFTLGTHALTQAAVGEIIGGTIEGVGALDPRKLINRFSGNKDAFQRNMFEELGNNIRTWSQDIAPIQLTQHAQNDLALDDASWWANMIPSTASSISMMIPAMGASTLARMLGIGAKAVKGLAELSEIGQFTKEALGISKLGTTAEIIANTGLNAIQAAKYSNIISDVSKGLSLGKIAATAENIVLPALVSRTIDSSREAVGRYQQYYQSYKDAGFNDDKAKQLAGDAAHYGFVTSHGNILFDLAEWTILSKLGNPAKEGLESMLEKSLGRNAKYAELTGDITKQSAWKTLLHENVPEYIKTGLVEGFDETSMDFFMDDAKRKTERDNGLSESNISGSMLERYIKHHLVAKNWESFIGGALGGIGSGIAMNIKGSIQSKYFNDDNNRIVDNIANDIIERTKESNEYQKQYNTAKANGQTAMAHNIRTLMINKTLQGSAINGTLGLDIERLENGNKLNPNEQAKLEQYQDEQGNYSPTAKNDIADVIKDLKKYKNIYDVEMVTPRTGDSNIDRYISVEIAAIKSTIQMNKDAIENLHNKDNDVTLETYHNETNKMASDLGDTNAELYNSLSNYERAKVNIDNNNNTIKQSMQNMQIDNLQNNVTILRNKLENTSDSMERKAIISQINKIESSINIYESSVKSSEQTIKQNNDTLASLKQEHDDFIANKKALLGEETFNELYNKVKHLHDTYNNEKQYLSENGDSLTQILKNQNIAIESELKHKLTKEYYSQRKVELDALQNMHSTKLINDFNTKINTIDNIEDLDNELSNANINNLDNKTKDSIFKLYKKRKQEIKDLDIKQKDVNANPATSSEKPVDITEETTTVKDEVVDGSAESLTSSPTRNLPSEDKSDNVTPKKLISKEGNYINIGDRLYITDSNTGETISNLPLNVIGINTKTSEVTFAGINANETYTVGINNISNLYSGTKVQNNQDFTTDLINKVLEHSNAIKKNETDHIYTFEEKQNKASGSNLLQTKYSDEESTETNATKVGSNVDRMYRDYFSDNGIQNKESYGIVNTAEYNNMIKYLGTIKRTLDLQGIRIIANGVKLFDSETGIAGEIDLLGIDKTNRVYIFDTKTKRMNGERHKFFSTSAGYNSFHSNIVQVNTYAALFEKIHKTAVDGLGIIPISVKYTENAKLNNIPDINRIQPANINNTSDLIAANKIANADIIEQQKALTPGTQIANINVDLSDGIIRFEPNIAALNIKSTNGETILERLKIENLVMPADNLTSIDLIDKYSELVNYLETKGAKDTKNVELNRLYNLLTSLFYVDKINGEYSIIPTDYIGNELIYDSILPISDLSNTINDLYNNNSNYFESLFKGSYLSSGKVKNQLAQVVKHLNPLYTNNVYFTIAPYLSSRSVSELTDNTQTLNQKSIEVVSTINDLLKSNIYSNNDYFITQQKNITLALQLIQLKQYIQIESDPTLSLEDAIKLVLTSYDTIQPDSALDLDSLTPIFLNLQNVLSSIKVETNSRRQFLIESELKDLHQIDKSVRWNNQTKTFERIDEFDTKHVVDWENNSNYRQYKYLDNLYNNIIIDTKAFNNTETKDYIKTSYITNIINRYSRNENISNKYFNVDLNSNLNIKTDEFGGVSDPTTYNLINSLQTGSAVNLVRNDKGIHVMVGTSDINDNNSLIGTILNISKEANNFTISKDGINYLGYTDLINTLKNNPELLSHDVLDHLKQLQVARLNATSRNKAISQLNINNSTYKNLMSVITNKSSNNELGKSIRNLIDMFVKNNRDTFIPSYDNDIIHSVMDILFFGNNVNFMENYKVSSIDALNRIKYYDNTLSINHSKYIMYNNMISDNNNSMASIQNISKPSIMFINSETKPILKDTIKVTKTNENPNSKLQIVNIRKGVMVDARGKSLLNKYNINNKNTKTDGFYVLLESTDGTHTLSPLKQNTLSDSYKGSLTDDTNYSDKALKYAKDVVKNIIFASTKKSGIKFQVGDRMEDYGVELSTLSGEEQDNAHKTINANIANIIKSNKFDNIVIVKGAEDDNSYHYFKTFSKLSQYDHQLVTFVMYKTVSKGIETLHSIRAKGDIIYYSKTDMNNIKNVQERIQNMKNEVPIEALTTNNIKIDLNTPGALDKLDTILDSLGGLLRQTNYGDNNTVNFATGNQKESPVEFTDPITNETYNINTENDAVEHALNTQAIYNYIGNVHDSEGNILTNMDLFGNNKLRFDIDAEGVTSIKKGIIENPLKTIRENQSVEFKEVIDVIDKIDSELEKEFKGKITEPTHKGYVPEKEGVIASITPTTHFDGSITFDYGYTDKFINSLYSKDKINNPIVSILHEHIHSIIISAVNLATNESQKRSIIENNNNQVSKFIEAFRKDFDSSFYLGDPSNFVVNEDYVAELKKQFNIENDSKSNANTKIRDRVMQFISIVEKDLTKAKDNFDSGSIDESAVSQELFTYFTNPFIMSVLSKTNDTEMKYERNKDNVKPTLIDRLVNMLTNIYNNVLKTLNIDTDINYAKNVKNMLSDLYYAMGNDSVENIQSTTTETTSNIDNEITDMPTKGRNRRNVELLSDNLVTNNINAIFAKTSISGSIADYTDDSNLKIC